MGLLLGVNGRYTFVLNVLELDDDTPTTLVTGDTADISHLCEFSWYDHVWYIDQMDPMQNKKIARYLGPSHDIGEAMCSKLLTVKGKQISRTSVIPLSTEDRNSQPIQRQLQEFDHSLKEELGARAEGLPVNAVTDDTPEYEPYFDETMSEPIVVKEADEYDLDTYHKLISARALLPRGDTKAPAKVIKRKLDDDGNLIGKANSNPLLDTSLYEVLFDDGGIEYYSANTIAENIFQQVDDEGNLFSILDEIIDHKKTNEAIHADDAFVIVNGKQHPRRTTKGWKLCIRWKDGTTSWETLAALKESNPVETAEYAVANKLVTEPAFNWWVTHVLRKRERIILKMKTRYQRTEQKFKSVIPKTVREAL
jgi:hypothetical protein